jgi:ABC-type Na+ efflux pump permease subunit
MSWLNRVLEEFGIHHEEYMVPPDVLAAIEEKKRKATAKNVTVVAELKKRKGMAGPKALAKNLKTSTVVAIPTISSSVSSAHASASAGEGSADGTGEDRADSVLEVDKPTFSAGAGGGRGLEGVEVLEPSQLIRCPMLWVVILALRMLKPRVVGPLLRLKRRRPKK